MRQVTPLMLLALKLPQLDELEVLRQIKGDAALKMSPVVMMSSRAKGRIWSAATGWA
jgi:CheY-like chemotaxis protein